MLSSMFRPLWVIIALGHHYSHRTEAIVLNPWGLALEKFPRNLQTQPSVACKSSILPV